MSGTNETSNCGYGEQLFQSVPCGIVQYSPEEAPRVLKFNNACTQIYGYRSTEEFRQMVSDSFEKMVYFYDIEFFKNYIRRALNTGQPVNFGHRILRQNQEIGYITGTISLIVLEDGTQVLQSIFQDSASHIMQADIRKSIYYQAMEARSDSKKIILADSNPASRLELRKALQDQYLIIEVDSASEVLSVLKKEEEDIAAVLISAKILISQDYRFIAALKGSILYATIPLITLADLTMRTEDLLSYGVNEVFYPPYNLNVIRLRLANLIELRDTAVQRNTIETLMNNLSGGVLIFKINQEGCAPLYFTDGVPLLSGMTPQEMETLINQGKCSTLVYEKDLERLIAALQKAASVREPVEVTFRVCQKNGTLSWIHMHGTEIRSERGECTYQCILSPTSSSEKMYMDIMNDSFNGIVVYGEHKDDLLYFNNAAVPFLSENLQEVFADEPLSEACYVKKQLLLADSRKHITLNGKIIDWNGIKAKIIYATDDTDSYRIQMERHQLYEMEISKLDNQPDNVVFSAIFNVNQDQLVELGADSLLELTVTCPYTISQCIQKLCSYAADPGQALDFGREFSAQSFLDKYQKGKTKQTLQCKIHRKDGGFQWIAINWTLAENPSTLELYAFFYIYDIHWDVIRQQSFAKILSFEEEYVAYLDLNSETIRLMILADPTQVINQGQVPYAQFRSEFWESSVCEKDLPLLREITTIDHLKQQLERESVYCYYYQTKSVDGQHRHKKVLVFYLDETKDILCFTRTDITDVQEEQQRQNDQLTAALTEARQANLAKSMFLSRMSHDIRTPMNAILGMSQLALDRIDDMALVRDHLEKILSSGSYLLGLINDILDMSRIESDRIQLEPEPYSIQECVDFVLVSMKTQLEEKQLSFSYLEAEPFPRYVMLDKMRSQQIFFNLISNAVKFTNEGGHIQVTVEAHELQPGLWNALIRITDDGIGIALEDQGRIFEAFEQAGAPGSVRQQGSGLGLAIVKNLIRLMGGTISVESQPGRGTTFTIRLQLQQADVAARAAEAASEKRMEDYDFSGIRVLLVEDHPINMEIARTMLEAKNCTIVEAGNGREALDALEVAPPGTYDVVFMDMQMPVMGGLDAARQIRSHRRSDLAAIPIIAMTANAFKEDIKISLDAGMNAHIVKPVNRAILYETLQQVLNQEKNHVGK